MKNLREVIRQIIKDDALYRRRDLPGDLDDPQPDNAGCSCGCGSCSDEEDYVTPKYALYSMIGDAIGIYDNMDDDSFEDDYMNETIMSIAEAISKLKNE